MLFLENISSLTIIDSMFAYTFSLSYLNLFKINNYTSIFDLFLSTSPNLKICVNDLETMNLLKSEGNYLNYMKIELQQNKCVEYCNESDYKYEYFKRQKYD